MSASGSLRLLADTHIGYRESLASSSNEIALQAGNHFLLGRNGRGKTTLLRSIAGSIPFLSGTAEIDGTVIYLSEDLCFDRELRAKQVINSLVPPTNRPQALEFAELIELTMDKPFAELSTGNKRKLAIIIGEFTAGAKEKPILLLDEPYTGLDDFVRSQIRERWESTSEEICRIIVAHPDQDDFLLPNALTISDGKLDALPTNASRTWKEVRQNLN